MREILFKGFINAEHDYYAATKIKPKWVYGFYSTSSALFTKPVPVIQNDEDDYIIIPETVCEFTGILDINKTKIFENDVIKASNGHIGWVIFEKGHFIKTCNCHKSNCEIISDNCEVIGNIFDNPELIEVK